MTEHQFGFGKGSLLTQPERLAVKQKRGKLFIGIPKEEDFGEHRIPITPPSVAFLVNNGHKVVIESGAGLKSKFTDNDFSEAGAEIKKDKKSVFEAHIIVKLSTLSKEELPFLKPEHTLITSLQTSTLSVDYIKQVQKTKVTALAFDFIKDNSGAYPFVRAMSEIAGTSAILMAAQILADPKQGKGILLGGISGVPPSKVVILGAGVVAEYAAQAAMGLGAIVKVFDDDIYKLKRLQNNVGQRVFTSILAPEVIENELMSADLAIGAIHSKTGRAPCVVTEEMVAKMKAGSLIMDVAIDQGGCFETSEVTWHKKPTFVKHDVIHYCVPNIPSNVPRTASYAFSNILTPLLMNINENGGVENSIRSEEKIKHGIYVYKGLLTNEYIGARTGLKYTDLDLMLTSRF